MAEIELLINEENTLAFDVEISGANTKNVEVRFVIETENYEFAFPGIMKGKTVEIKIPILSQVVTPDIYRSRLEFILEGEKYFAPMRTDVELIQPVKVTAGIRESKKSVKESKKAKVVVRSFKTLNEKILDNMDKFAKAKNLNKLLKVYNKKITEEENVKDALSLINSVCQNEHGKSFKDYIKDK